MAQSAHGVSVIRSCVACGYSGPGAACTICRGEGKLSAACAENYCPLCNQPMRGRFDWLRFVSMLLCAFGAGILALLVCTLLGGCGPRFTAHADLFTDDASADAAAGAGDAGGAAGDDAAGGAAGDVSIPEPAQGGTAGVSAGTAGAPSAGHAGALEVGGGGAGGATSCGFAGSKATAFASFDPPIGGPPSSALDGDLTTRWASGEAQAAGQWFRLDLPAGTVLELLELEGPAADMPLELELELDGAAVASTTSKRGDVLGLALAKPTPARVLRLLIVSPAPGQWWSIRELRQVCK